MARATKLQQRDPCAFKGKPKRGNHYKGLNMIKQRDSPAPLEERRREGESGGGGETSRGREGERVLHSFGQLASSVLVKNCVLDPCSVIRASGSTLAKSRRMRFSDNRFVEVFHKHQLGKNRAFH